MATFAVLATGPSLTQEVVDYVRGRCGVVAVSDAYRLAPWADALVSQDRAWWVQHPEALDFAGRKFCGVRADVKGTEKANAAGIISSGTNSGLLGCHVAVTELGATRLLLLGFDMRGSHFFGPHPKPLNNTTPARYEVMLRQFKQWSHKGIEVLNCTTGSALTCFPMADIREALCGHG